MSQRTVADVDKVYLMAFDENLKGITIYRDGCKADQPMSTGKAEVKPEAAAPAAPAKPMGPRERAKVTTGFTERVKTGCGNMYITINTDSTGICEVFSHLGKAGGCATAQLESTCRLASLALRSGVPIDDVAKQLKGIRCPSIAWDNGKSVLSCADAIATVLENYINSGLSVKLEGKAETNGNGNGKATPGTVTAVSMNGVHTIVLVVAKEPAGNRDPSMPEVRTGITNTLKSRKEQVLQAAYISSLRNNVVVVNLLAQRLLESQCTMPSLAPAAPGK